MARLKLIILLIALIDFPAFSQLDSLIIKLDNYNYTEQAEYLSDLLKVDSIVAPKADNMQRAQIKNKLGFFYYNRDYYKAIGYFESAGFYYNKSGDKHEANCYLNIASIYDEKLGLNRPAIQYLYKSLSVGERVKDTLYQATILKYLGALKGKEKDFTSGKKDIQKAINLFESKNFRRGTAVCYYDLAIVYFNEYKLDSCILSLNTSKRIQQEFKSIDRIVGINNYLLKVYLTKQDLTNFRIIRNENEENIKNEDVKNVDRIAYFQVLVEYFELIKDFTNQRLYLNKISKLNDSD